MRLKTRRGLSGVLAFILLFGLLPTIWFPTASALTWSAGTTIAGVDTTPSITASGSNVIISYKNGALGVGRSSNGGSSFTASTIDGSGSGSESRVWYSGTKLFLCTTNSPNVQYYLSTDNGVFWTTAQTLQAGSGCRGGSFNGLSMVAAYSDTATSVAKAQISTDGGSTFGSQTSVTTTNLSPTDYSTASSTTWAFTAGTKFCITTNTGSSYTCSTISTLTGGMGLAYITGSSWIVANVESNVLKIAKTEDNGVTWTSPLSIGTFAASAAADVVVTSSTDYSVFFTQYDSGVAHGYVKRSYSSDSGATWTTETVRDITRIDSSSSGMNGVQAVISSGVFHVAYGWFGVNPASFVGYSSATYDSSTGALGNLASVAVTNLVGYDVNPLGDTVVVRGNSGEFVSIYAAKTGTVSSAIVVSSVGNDDGADTDCNQADGVFVNYQGTKVAYVDCDGSAVPRSLQFRTNAGQNPDFADCDSGTNKVLFSDFDPGDAGAEQKGKLGQIRDYPIDQTNVHGSLGQDQCQVAWGWASQASSGSYVGQIGMDLWTNIETDADNFDSVRGQAASSNVDDFCVGLDPTSDYYIASVKTGSDTKIFPVDLFTTFDIGEERLDGTIGSPATPGYSNGYGIACGQDNIALETGTTVVLIDASTGQQVWTSAITRVSDGDTRGVAVSETFKTDGTDCNWGTSGCKQYVAYKEGTTIKIVDGSTATPTQTATVDVRSGTWKGMVMDYHGQYLWQFTSNGWTVTDIHTATTVTPVGSGSTPPSTTTPSAGGLFAGANAAVGEGTGGGDFGGGLFLMVLMVIFMGAGFYFAFKQSLIMLMVGLVAGFLMSWGFGFIGGGVVFAAVLLAGAAIYFFARGRGSPG